MKSFFLVLNILAFILPFLGAEVQNQKQPTCRETDRRLFDQSTVKYIPIHYAWKSYPRIAPNYYQYRPAVPINNQYMPYPYYTKPVLIRPHAQIPQWQALPNIYPPTLVRHPYLHPSLISIPPKKNQDKADIPTDNTIAAVEPILIPPSEPTVSTVATQEASSQIITNTPETTTVTITSPTSVV
ncbi:kappa-casein [Eptesicus fuscus]|uniref:kappa-casein n=1 Tax=Eptesicus fuscus TaxID=29078 RepID=UPI00240476E2|nr:kappa-casein [Eptesicus fuscus]